MGVPMAYGDSRSYFQTVRGIDFAQNAEIAARQQASAYAQQAANYQSPYANAYHIMRHPLLPVKAQSRTLVVSRNGFGGGGRKKRLDDRAK